MSKNEKTVVDRATGEVRQERHLKAESLQTDLAKIKTDPTDPHAKARARKFRQVFTKPSRTVRSQAYETDINNMVKGLTPFTQRKRPGFFVDETNLPLNYEAQFNAIQEAHEAFMLLPPEIRELFGNDPANLSRALGDPSNHAKLRELGIIKPLGQDNPPAEQKQGEAAQPPKGAKVAEGGAGSGGVSPQGAEAPSSGKSS